MSILQGKETALHWASREGYTDIVKILLEKHAQVDAQNEVSFGKKLHYMCVYIALHSEYKQSFLLVPGIEIVWGQDLAVTPVHGIY